MQSDSLYNWKDDGSNPCDPNNVWVGVICSNDQISILDLSSLDLEGQPDLCVLESLDGLKVISIQNNSLVGPMPEINHLRFLKAFYAGSNWFSGVIPSDFFQTLGSLKRLWLQHNNFSGQIPISIAQLPNLKELHLEYNEFSGPIPAFMEPDIITTLDLSNNKLQGEIPKSLSNFDAKVFENNAELCGPTLSKDCNVPSSPQPEPSTRSKTTVLWIIMLVMAALMIFIIVAKTLQVEEDRKRPFAEVLGNGGLGSAYKATLGNGVSVVVKRVREMNQMTKEVFDIEMKKLAKLRHQNILTPLAYHFRKEEKLLVSEYVSKGSLLYILHGERGNSRAAEIELNWDKRLKIIKGVARGMGFLHTEFASYPLPHGDLKSSNVLIGSDYEPLLSDYAFYPLLNNTPTVQCMFAFKSPEFILNQKVVQKSDVYCMGIVILELMTGKYPSQYCNNQKEKGGTDVVQWVKSALAENRGKELIDPEILSEASVSEMEKILRIGSACTESEIDERIDLTEAIRRIEEAVLNRVHPPRPDWYEEFYAAAIDDSMKSYEAERTSSLPVTPIAQSDQEFVLGNSGGSVNLEVEFKSEIGDLGRFAKRKLDESVFIGNRLQVSYAPQYESLSDTKEKLEGRRKEVVARLNPARSKGSSASSSSAGSTPTHKNFISQPLNIQQSNPRGAQPQHTIHSRTFPSTVSSNEDYFPVDSMNQTVRLVREKLNKIESSADTLKEGSSKRPRNDNRRRI
ncbi:hypothetical protein SSX86_020950 [Deinandra increscens subsp. villosa]|uniref:Protein kinase domain-containing protein n=1 Tax=Deinandra increscens subsp. villosa TaxID=3103831 RepID=A0AAP0CQB6_9ASTR